MHLKKPSHLVLLHLVFATLIEGVACSSDDGGVDSGSDTIANNSSNSNDNSGVDVLSQEQEMPAASDNEVVQASCYYTNPFSSSDECKEYVGDAWSKTDIASDCGEVFGQSGELRLGEACSFESFLGTCTNVDYAQRTSRTVSAGDNSGDCAATQTGCESFGGGSFEPSALCTSGDTIGTPGTVYQVPYEICMDPLPGDDPGMSEEGQVCTYNAIQGCTEPGRHFGDYASCEDVLTQRPYWANPKVETIDATDPRLSDETFLSESAWVRDQINSCACVCCHADSYTPNGVGQWDTEAGPLWVDTFSDSGLAMMAGWVPSDAFGLYPPELNHGFDRSVTGAPTTDINRMIRFFEGELARRGSSESEWNNYPEFGAFMYDFIDYEPEACESGVGVSSDGTITWGNGNARYIYVLESGSKSPAAPPSFDMPEGVLYRADVQPSDLGVTNELKIGEEDLTSASRVFPEEGSTFELVEGQEYYLHVSSDMLVPLKRCTFTY